MSNSRKKISSKTANPASLNRRDSIHQKTQLNTIKKIFDFIEAPELLDSYDDHESAPGVGNFDISSHSREEKPSAERIDALNDKISKNLINALIQLLNYRGPIELQHWRNQLLAGHLTRLEVAVKNKQNLLNNEDFKIDELLLIEQGELFFGLSTYSTLVQLTEHDTLNSIAYDVLNKSSTTMKSLIKLNKHIQARIIVHSELVSLSDLQDNPGYNNSNDKLRYHTYNVYDIAKDLTRKFFETYTRGTDNLNFLSQSLKNVQQALITKDQSDIDILYQSASDARGKDTLFNKFCRALCSLVAALFLYFNKTRSKGDLKDFRKDLYKLAKTIKADKSKSESTICTEKNYEQVPSQNSTDNKADLNSSDERLSAACPHKH